MFVENYRRENTESIMGGSPSTLNPIPYPKISDEDWRVWSICSCRSDPSTSIKLPSLNRDTG